MSDHFTPEALAFLDDLKANNSRDWFTAHKKTYEAEIKGPAQAFADFMSSELKAITGAAHTPKIFRIHRDVRFSKDKTPYNAHVHIAFAPDLELEAKPMWFFGLGTEQLTLGCGIFGFEKEALTAFRDDMAGPRGAELIAMTRDFEGKGLRIREPAMKTVPRGYDRDHPHAEALRRKGYAVWKDIGDRGFVTKPGLAARCRGEFEAMLPVYRFFGG